MIASHFVPGDGTPRGEVVLPERDAVLDPRRDAHLVAAGRHEVVAPPAIGDASELVCSVPTFAGDPQPVSTDVGGEDTWTEPGVQERHRQRVGLLSRRAPGDPHADLGALVHLHLLDEREQALRVAQEPGRAVHQALDERLALAREVASFEGAQARIRRQPLSARDALDRVERDAMRMGSQTVSRPQVEQPLQLVPQDLVGHTSPVRPRRASV